MSHVVSNYRSQGSDSSCLTHQAGLALARDQRPRDQRPRDQRPETERCMRAAWYFTSWFSSNPSSSVPKPRLSHPPPSLPLLSATHSVIASMQQPRECEGAILNESLRFWKAIQITSQTYEATHQARSRHRHPTIPAAREFRQRTLN